MKKTLLPLSALALLTMIGAAACGGQSSSSPATSETSTTSVAPSSSTATYKVSITNKEALQATWYVGDAARSVTVDLTPKVNILDAIADGTLKIESSNAEVVKATGASLSPVAKGTATITVTYHNVKDTVEVTIGEATAKEKYGTVHAGTLEDPLDNADAVKVGLWAKENGDTKEDLYIKGEVERFYEAPGERAGGEVSFYLKAEGEDQQFEVYRVMKKGEDGSTTGLTYAEITVGSNVVVYGRITYYASAKQPETSQGTTFFVSSDKGETEEPKVVEAESVAKVVEQGLKLADGASTYDFVKVTGYVVIKDGSNFWLADEKKFDLKKTDLLELYGVSKEAEAMCLKGAKITVTLRLKNYHNQVEAIGMKDFVEVTKGEPWVINYTEKDVAGALEVINALEDGKTTEDYYAVTGVIGEITTPYSEKYGNISFTMGDNANDTTLLTVFRCTADAETAAKLVAGTKVKIGGKLQKYVKEEAMTPELTGGVVLDITEEEEGEVDPLAEDIALDFSVLTAKGAAIDEKALETVKAAAGNQAEQIKKASAVKVYDGNGTGGALENTAGLLKFGSSKENGVLTLKIGGLANRVTLKAHDFYVISEKYPTTKDTIKVNGVEQAMPYLAEATPTEVTFEIPEDDDIEISFVGRGYLFEATFSYVAPNA